MVPAEADRSACTTASARFQRVGISLAGFLGEHSWLLLGRVFREKGDGMSRMVYVCMGVRVCLRGTRAHSSVCVQGGGCCVGVLVCVYEPYVMRHFVKKAEILPFLHCYIDEKSQSVEMQLFPSNIPKIGESSIPDCQVHAHYKSAPRGPSTP